MSSSLFLFLLAMQAVLMFCMLGLVAYAAYIAWTFRRELPYVPTPYRVIRRMIALAEIQPHDCVVDLGSGTGRIVLEVARQYPATAIGIEQSRLLIAAARLRQRFTRQRGKVVWKHDDLFTYPLDDVTVVFCFLTTAVLTRLAPRFAQMRSGSRIVSYKFAPPLREGWETHTVRFGRGEVLYCCRKL